MKTKTSVRSGLRSTSLKHTEARGKDSDIEIGGKLLHLCREHALACYNVARQAHTNHLQDRLEDKHGETRQRGM